MLHIPQGTAHIRILICAWTGSRRRPWNCLVLYLGGTIGAQWAVDSAIGAGFCKLLSVFARLYTPHTPQFYMPTFGNHRNNSKTAPISLYFVRFPLENPGLRWLQWAIFSVEDTHVTLPEWNAKILHVKCYFRHEWSTHVLQNIKSYVLRCTTIAF